VERTVPASRQIAARIAFLRALAIHSDAIGRLRSCPSPAASDGQRALLKLPDGDHAIWRIGLSRKEVLAIAGPKRVAVASTWAKASKLGGVSWLEHWAAFAMVAWDLARTALDLVATPEIMRRLDVGTKGVWMSVETSYPQTERNPSEAHNRR
jgi:hypothetical protein